MVSENNNDHRRRYLNVFYPDPEFFSEFSTNFHSSINSYFSRQHILPLFAERVTPLFFYVAAFNPYANEAGFNERPATKVT